MGMGIPMALMGPMETTTIQTNSRPTQREVRKPLSMPIGKTEWF
jgi:hypothetical protein